MRTPGVTLKLCQSTITGQTFFLQCSQSHQKPAERSGTSPCALTSHHITSHGITPSRWWHGFNLNLEPVTCLPTFCSFFYGERADPRSERGWASEAPVEGVGGLFGVFAALKHRKKTVNNRAAHWTGRSAHQQFPNAAAAAAPFKCTVGAEESRHSETDRGLALLPDRGTNKGERCVSHLS